MTTDTRTGPDPGLAEQLPVPTLLEIFGDFDSAKLLEHGDVHLPGDSTSPRQALLLGDQHGLSYGLVDYTLKPEVSFHQRRAFLSASAESFSLRDDNFPGLLDNISIRDFLINKLATNETTGSFCRALGFKYEWRGMPEDSAVEKVKVIIVPTPERVNVMLREVFGRTPEADYPQFRTFRRADGTSGKLTLDEFIGELADGYYPVAAGDLAKGDPEFFVHDAVDHLPGYALFHPELNRLIRQTATDLNAIPGDSYNHIKLDLADAVDELSDSLRSVLADGYIKPESSGFFSPDTLSKYLKAHGYLQSYIKKILIARHDTSQTAETGVQDGWDYQKPHIPGEEISAIIQGLADNMSDMLNTAIEHEQAQAA